MGIPAFYRWLTTRYEKTVVSAVEETPSTVSGVAVPLQTSDPNPNGVEYDNLYLDMNNIIHPCFHSEHLPAPSSYEEVFQGVFKYVDKIFSIVRPRKLLYMAIDGVAPRAKMNQQRSRRFRAAKDVADEARNLGHSSGDVLELEGETEEERWSKKLDSNVITPGTEFMDLLSRALRYYIHLRMNNDPGWQGIKVILSDATVPGEGEHKIMSYIRLQRNLPGYDPNTRHCLYGLDADLIMLALATHEVHFTILREDVRKVNQETKKSTRKTRRKLGQQKHNQGLLKTEKASDMLDRHISGLEFQLLNIWVLREYLVHDMKAPNSPVETELERLIDDFVFICLFIGNDFLPHIPSLEISEGAIDLLMAVYKKEFVQMGGYLTNSFEIDLRHLEHFIQAVGSHENAIFRKRHHMQKSQGAQNKDFSMHQSGLKLSKLPLGDSGILPESHELSKPPRAAARSFGEEQHDVHSDIDLVRLGEEGWKERYYAEKFDAECKDEQERARRHAVMKYMEGIAWVMRYYYEGVCSWDWFYPYHYAPFASDFCGLDQLEIKFSLGKPFKPFDQLMTVLPAASAHALPLLYRKLMTDPSSPLLDLYPSDFEIDMNGKRFSWQAICKLPFIEESRLLSEIAKVEHTLTEDERRRNSWGLDTLFVRIVHPLAVMIVAFLGEHNDVESLDTEVSIEIDPETSGGMNGYIKVTKGTLQPREIYSPIDGMEMIGENKILTVLYELPHFHPHVPMLLEGVIFPDKLVKKQEMPHQHSLWHETRSHHHVSSRMPIKNAISGSRLARCAHILVSKVIPPKQQDQRGPFRPSYASGRLGVAEVKTRTSEGLGKTKSLNGRRKGGNDNEEAVPNKRSNSGELEGRCVNPDGYSLIGTTAEKKSEITKKRKKRSVEDNDNVQGLEGIILEERKASQGCDGAIMSNQAGESTTEMTAKKKQKRETRQAADSSNVQSLESSFLEERNESAENDMPMLLNRVSGEKIKVETREIQRRKGRTRCEDGDEIQHWTSCDLKEEKASSDCHEPSGKAVEAKFDEKPNKKLRRRRVEENNIAPSDTQNTESLESTFLEERNESAKNDMSMLSNQVALGKNEAETREKQSKKEETPQGEGGDKIQHLTSSDLNEENASADCERHAHSDPVEAKVDEKPKKKSRRRRIKKNNIAPSGTQKMESCAAGEDAQLAFAHMELKTERETNKKRGVKINGGTVNNIASSGTQTTERCAAGEDREHVLAQSASDKALEAKIDEKPKKTKRGVKRKRGTVNNNALSGTQTPESWAAGEDKLHVLAQSAQDKALEAKINEKPKKTKRGVRRKRGTVNNNALSGTETPESWAAGEDKLHVLAQSAQDKALEAKINEKPKKKRRRRRVKENNISPSDTQNTESLESSFHEERNESAENDMSMLSNQASGGQNGVETREEQSRKGTTQGEGGNKIQHLTSCDLNEEKASADCELHAPSDKAVEAKVDGKPKKKRRSRRIKENNIAPNGTQNTESCAAGEDRQPAFAHMELKTEGQTKKRRGVRRKRGTVNSIAPSGTQTTESCAAGKDIQHVLAQAVPDEIECLTSSIFVQPKVVSDFPTGSNNGTELEKEMRSI